jgi:acetate---CoA ligase (ADP-forming)
MLSVSGGATSLIGDLGAAAGLHFPEISGDTNRRLQQILGVQRRFANPIDTIGMPRLRSGANMAAILDALLADEGIHVIGLALGMRMKGADAHHELVHRMAAANKAASKPLAVVSFMANSLTSEWRGFARHEGLPVIEDIERGLRALRHLIDYAAFRRRVGRDDPSLEPPQLPLPALSRTVLTEAESKTILAAAGLPVTTEALARTPEETVRLAAIIGGPVALKVQSPDIPHKSEVGGVYLGARTPAEIDAAARQVLENARRARPGADIHGVLVQEMVGDGAEFILGMVYDEQFGPIVVLGAGGVAVDLFKDVVCGLPPLSAEAIRDMIGRLKSATQLASFRGRPARDVAALVDCCVQFAAFCAATDGRFAAIDLNPVLVRAVGQGVCIVDALMVRRDAKEEALS